MAAFGETVHGIQNNLPNVVNIFLTDYMNNK